MAGMVRQLHRIDRPDLDAQALEREDRGGIADMAIDHMGLDGEKIHGMNMPKRRFTGQPKRVIRAIAFENDRGALLPSRFVCSADCTPVN
jgi:hypothetical protein